MKKMASLSIRDTALGIGMVVLLFLLAFFADQGLYRISSPNPDFGLGSFTQADQNIPISSPIAKQLGTDAQPSVQKFLDAEDFRQYISRNVQKESDFSTSDRGQMAAPSLMREMSLENVSSSGSVASRFSETNVQITGIDEADIVKTDGKNIFFSREGVHGFIEDNLRPIHDGVSFEMSPQETQGTTSIVKAFPPESMGIENSLEVSGDLLLVNSTLFVFSRDDLVAYDVSVANEPKQLWKKTLNKGTQFIDTRLVDGKVYVFTHTSLQPSMACPIEIMRDEMSLLTVSCGDIYHPTVATSVDSTVTLLQINTETGESERTVSFVTGANESSWALFPSAAYFSSFVPAKDSVIISDVLIQSELIPSGVQKDIERVIGYDIGEQAKFIEVERILGQYRFSLLQDDRMKFDTELANQVNGYLNTNKRNLEKTFISKVNLETFSLEGVTSVPGRLLNQFAMDEYEGNVRIATTIGGRISPFASNQQSESDVIILNKNLKKVGEVQGLGEGERIYSVRFVQDKGYVVTFRQVDPFYIIDLSHPEAPSITGELKIPGYSSYLHPLSQEHILGIGKEDGQVKLSLFDVSDVSSPKEISKYLLDEYWSDILDTHHAFLVDVESRQFFVPAGKGLYVFSYNNDELQLVKTIQTSAPKRVLYLDNYLYSISDREILVYSQDTWSKVNSLSL